MPVALVELGVIRIPKGVRRMVGLQHRGHSPERARGSLVHIAMPVLVDKQPAEVFLQLPPRPDAYIAAHAATWNDILPCRPDPKAHAVPVAAIQAAHGDGDVVVDIGAVLEIRCGPSAVLFHHLTVRGEISRCEDDGLFPDILREAPVLKLRQDRIDPAILAVRAASANQLARNRTVVDGPAGFLDLLGERFHDEALAAAGRRRFRVAPSMRRHGLPERA